MPAAIRLRTGQYRKYAALKGWKNQAEAASAIGVTEPTIGRILTGKRGPGEAFIAGLLTALPELEFNDLFEVVNDDEPEQVPA